MPHETRRESAAGGIANLALYRLCNEWSEHGNVGHIKSKMKLIARYYSVSRNMHGEWKHVAKALRGIGRKLDNKLSSIGSVAFPSGISIITEIHTMVDKSVCEALNEQNHTVVSRPSFASKYLHFHAPDAFPLMDSLASAGLRSFTRGFRTKLESPTRYARFCERLADLLQHPKWQGTSLREIDTLLMREGRRVAEAKTTKKLKMSLARQRRKPNVTKRQQS